jgi:hypothetical protein
MMDDNPPLLSRCSLGKNKWFWVTWRDFGAICNEQVDASGYATSASAAAQQARASIQSRFGQTSAEQLNTNFASVVHRREAIKRRASRKSVATDAKENEYLYTDDTSDYDGHWYSSKYRIVKKTANQVYVKHHMRTWEEEGQTYHDVETIVLDRHKLETEGCASSRRHGDFFYTTPWEARNKPSTPRCLEVLGLEGGANEEAISVAYRCLAKEHHPDHGGNVEEFKRIQEAYEAATSSVS